VLGELVKTIDFNKEDDMDMVWLSLFWTGPIGIGIFLTGLGVLFWGIGQLRSKKE
jgi:hypothetical protein